MSEYCLRWNNHRPNLVTVFSELLTSEALVDVTLATDGHYIHAHKLVLSACSVYFKDLFGANPCKHPIVILKDIRIDDLKTVIDFIYRGEVNVAQDRLQDVLKTAESLRIKGLAENPRSSYDELSSHGARFSASSLGSQVTRQRSSLTDSREQSLSLEGEDETEPGTPPSSKRRKITPSFDSSESQHEKMSSTKMSNFDVDSEQIDIAKVTRKLPNTLQVTSHSVQDIQSASDVQSQTTTKTSSTFIKETTSTSAGLTCVLVPDTSLTFVKEDSSTSARQKCELVPEPSSTSIKEDPAPSVKQTHELVILHSKATPSSPSECQMVTDKDIPDCWTPAIFAAKVQQYPWLSSSNGGLGCQPCRDARYIPGQKHVHFAQEWVTSTVYPYGITKEKQLTSLRKKIYEHKQSAAHKKAEILHHLPLCFIPKKAERMKKQPSKEKKKKVLVSQNMKCETDPSSSNC